MIDLVNLQTPLEAGILDHLPDAIVVVDADGQPLLCNRQAKDWLSDYLACLWAIDPHTQYQALDRHRCALSLDQLPLRRVVAGEMIENEDFILVQRGSDHLLWVAVSGGPLPPGGSAAGILSVRDISARKHQERQLNHQAYCDALTQLPNRVALVDRLNHLLAQGREADSMALLFIDLNRFKQVNENLGHRVGNQLLTELGRRIKDTLPPQAMAARLGGDEFAVVVEHLASQEVAIALAETLWRAIAQPTPLANPDLRVEASIGIAPGPAAYRHGEDWLRDANTAMNQVKDLAGCHWCIFDGALEAQYSQRLEAEAALRHALENGELQLYYQPIVTISNQAIIGFEALVRWQHPERGLILPGEFIGIAESSGLIIPLSWWVLEEACRQMQAWTEAYPQMADLTISVNMSSKQFFQKHLVNGVKDILANTGLDPHRLKLEITEGVLIDHSASIIATLEELRDMGIRLAVDDFGTGYSSLSYLHQFPFDSLKIDRSFIENADQDFEKLEILQSVVRLAWNLGLDVVAEGVETHRHYAQLRALRCESGQGFLFSQPLPPTAVEQVIQGELAPAPAPQGEPDPELEPGMDDDLIVD
ncbi:MAG: EAL domain-containing protein [Leptolyngbya sp.]|nr:EAL domain-containing protein [Leptolyngbya sp.]